MSLNRGQAAKAAQVGSETLRYYERIGIIPKPARSAGNYRVYDDETVQRIRFVKHAQDLGFSLEEIDELLSLRATKGSKAADVKRRAQAKIRDVEQRISSLQNIRAALSELVENCSGSGPASTCTILHAIDHGLDKHEEKGETH